MSKKKKKATKKGTSKRGIKNAKPEFYFKLIDGSEIKNILELADAFDRMSDDAFYFHVNDNGNHFSCWVRDVFDDKELADEIEKINNKMEAQIKVLRHIIKRLR